MTEQQAAGAENQETEVPPGESGDPVTPPEDESGKTFDADYVKKLRDEAAEHRTKKNEADARNAALSQRLLSTMIEGTATDLADPGDLLAWTKAEDLYDDEGLPDKAKILAAQENLLKLKPYLRTRDARGDIDQGGQGRETDTFSFNDWLTSSAG